MNSESSRSHSVFTLLIRSGEEGGETTTFRKCHFIDLAGSERQSDTQATGVRLQEANNINQSLSTLGTIIHKLTERVRPKHIPYRDSVLTMILKDSLGGNSKTFMIAAVSPAASAVQETTCTLLFAQRVNSIVNMACVNEESSSSSSS